MCIGRTDFLLALKSDLIQIAMHTKLILFEHMQNGEQQENKKCDVRYYGREGTTGKTE